MVDFPRPGHIYTLHRGAIDMCASIFYCVMLSEAMTIYQHLFISFLPSYKATRKEKERNDRNHGTLNKLT